jgi:hypothetical protein
MWRSHIGQPDSLEYYSDSTIDELLLSTGISISHYYIVLLPLPSASRSSSTHMVEELRTTFTQNSSTPAVGDLKAAVVSGIPRSLEFH